MEASLNKILQTSIRSEVTATFDADSSGVLDAGVGRSFVGIHIATALGAGTTLTFKGYAGGDDLTSSPAEGDLDLIRVENSDGSAAASYTIEADADVGYFPLDPAVFNGCRFLQILSDVDNTASTARLVSKPV